MAIINLIRIPGQDGIQEKKYFFESRYVHVFPATFRGQYAEESQQKQFDPESRLNTEKNLTSIAIGGGLAGSYILS